MTEKRELHLCCVCVKDGWIKKKNVESPFPSQSQSRKISLSYFIESKIALLGGEANLTSRGECMETKKGRGGTKRNKQDTQSGHVEDKPRNNLVVAPSTLITTSGLEPTRKVSA